MFKSVKTRSYKEYCEQEDKAWEALKQVRDQYCAEKCSYKMSGLFGVPNWITPKRLRIIKNNLTYSI